MRLKNIFAVLAVGGFLGGCAMGTNLEANNSSQNDVMTSPLRILPKQAKCNIPVHYPLKARRESRQGKVFIHTVIDTTGRVESAEVERSSGEAMLDDAALAAVKAMTCVPYAAGAKATAVRVEMTQPIVFQLDPAPVGMFR